MKDLTIVEILLVEDNPRDAELTIRALRKQNLADQIFHLEDGAQALDFLFGRGRYEDMELKKMPKVILLDLKLPKLNGFEVLSAIRSHDRTRDIPVVVVSSSAEDPDLHAAYQLGANSYVIKPVQFDAFSEAMKRLGIYWLLVNHPPVQ